MEGGDSLNATFRRGVRRRCVVRFPRLGRQSDTGEWVHLHRRQCRMNNLPGFRLRFSLQLLTWINLRNVFSETR
jgi:hypothetical protein